MICEIQNKNVELKDILTIVVLVATIFSSHWLASKQTRKAKKAKWIEDLRLEVANMISLSQQVEMHDVKTLFPFSRSGYVVTMLLDQNVENQNTLLLEVQAFGRFMTDQASPTGRLFISEYKDRVEKITNMTKYIIKQEEKKL